MTKGRALIKCKKIISQRVKQSKEWEEQEELKEVFATDSMMKNFIIIWKISSSQISSKTT